MELEKRILLRCRMDKESKCWTWTGGHIGNVPYFNSGKERGRVRVRDILFKNEPGSGKTLFPGCGNRSCVNPDHCSAIDTSKARGMKMAKKISDYVAARLIAVHPCLIWKGSVDVNSPVYKKRVRGARKYINIRNLLYPKAIDSNEKLIPTCGNKRCVSPRHAEIRHKQFNNYKLHAEQVALIKSALKLTDLKPKDVAESFGVSAATIYKIASGNTWKDITPDTPLSMALSGDEHVNNVNIYEWSLLG